MVKTNFTLEDFDNFDIKPYYAARKLRRERPWTYDIIRALWGRPSGDEWKNLYPLLWDMRNPSGLPMPDSFKETVRRSVYNHTSEGAGTAKPEDDLFFSPKRGIWAVRPKAAAAWLKRHDLPEE